MRKTRMFILGSIIAAMLITSCAGGKFEGDISEYASGTAVESQISGIASAAAPEKSLSAITSGTIKAAESETAAETAPILPPPEKSYEPYELKLYNPLGTGVKRPDDYVRPDTYYSAGNYYQLNRIVENREDFLIDKDIQKKIYDWVDAAASELEPEFSEFYSFVENGIILNSWEDTLQYDVSVINGYIFIIVCLPNFYVRDAEYHRHYYDLRSAAFDLYTGEALELSDFFFEGEEFMPRINGLISIESKKARSIEYMPIKREFAGLIEDGFNFDYSRIILPVRNPYFKYGAEFSVNLTGFDGALLLKRDMEGLLEESVSVDEYNIYKDYTVEINIKTEEYREGNVAVNILREYEDVPKDKLDWINQKMKDMIRDENVVRLYYERLGFTIDAGGQRTDIEEKYYNPQREADGVSYSDLRHSVTAEINQECGFIRFQLDGLWATGEFDGIFTRWLDYETFEALDAEALAKKLFGDYDVEDLSFEYSGYYEYGQIPEISDPPELSGYDETMIYDVVITEGKPEMWLFIEDEWTFYKF